MATTTKKLQRFYSSDGALTSKECRGCQQILPITSFYKKGTVSQTNTDGFEHRCIQCHKQRWHEHASDPEQRKRWLLERIRAKCKKQNIPFNLTIEDLVIPDVCPVLGIPLKFGVKGYAFRDRRGVQTPDDSPSADRIDPDGGYVKGNVVIVSYRANLIKTNATVDELVKIADYYSKLVGK